MKKPKRIEVDSKNEGAINEDRQRSRDIQN